MKPDRTIALEYFLKARKGIQARLERDPGYGDETVAENSEKTIASISG